MSLIILFFIQLFAFSLVYHIDIVNMEVISQIFIILNLLLSIFYFNKSFPKRITIILSSALFVRILALIVDMYFHPLLFSGNDTEVFHHITVSNVANGSIDQSLTSYTDFLYYIYNLCDSQRIIAQYLNVVFGISSMIVLYKITQLLNINKHLVYKALWILTFLPTFISISVGLLRDAWIIFFIIFSVYYFILWSINLRLITLVSCLVSIVLASIMHAGVAVILPFYFIVFAFYSRGTDKVQVSGVSFIYIAIMMLFSIVIMSNQSLFLGKFGAIDDESVLETINYELVDAGSSYLRWINPSSFLQLMLFSPLKFTYFLFSPMPWNIRGIVDLITFILDSSLYIYLCYQIYILRRFLKYKSIIRFVLLAFVVITMAYSWGTVATGTAVRHRLKVVLILFVIYLFLKNTYEENRKNNDNIP